MYRICPDKPTLSAVSRVARADQMGGALGLVQASGSMGQVIGLTIAGPLYQAGTGQLFGFGCGISRVLLIIVWQIKIRRITPAKP